MSDFIKTSNSPDFFKDFEIESPTEVIENQTTEIEKLKEQLENPEETIKSLEELQKELEVEDKPKEEDKKEEVKVEEQDKVETADPEYSFKPFIEIMAESGVLDLPKGSEIGETAEDLVEAFETTVNSRISEGIEQYKDSVPDLGKQFLEYLENGGDPKRFIEAATDTIDFATLDLTDEANQKLVIKEHLKLQGYTADEIKEEIQDYEDGLMLEKKAKMAAKKVEVVQGKRLEEEVKSQQKELKEREKALNVYVSDIQKLIKESKEIAGLQVEEADKKDFEAYLFKRDKAGLTQYQKDLNENPNKTQVELAYLKYKKYDFAKAAKKGENTAAKKIRDSIVTKSETTIKGSTAEQPAGKTDLTAFEKMFKNMQKQ